MNKFELQTRELFDIDKRIYFIFLCLFTFLVLLMKKNFIEAETAAFQVLESRGQMGALKAINTLQYLSIPLVYLWKFTLIALLLWLGTFIFGYKIAFYKCWTVAMIAETIFLAPEIIKIAYFTMGTDDPSLYDVKAYYPLSLMSLVNYVEIDDRYHYPLKALNVFELLYWIILWYGVHLAAKKDWWVAVLSVASSYVLFFFLWIWFFITVYR